MHGHAGSTVSVEDGSLPPEIPVICRTSGGSDHAFDRQKL
jgi:hypothetical protein